MEWIIHDPTDHRPGSCVSHSALFLASMLFPTLHGVEAWELHL